MQVTDQIHRYIKSLPGPKQADISRLHALILTWAPGARLWFLDGKDDTGKVVSNPSIGYGMLERHYADGRTREFYRVGISANSAGLSVYVMGMADKAYLGDTYGAALGKAQVTGYCIRFRSLKDIDLTTLERVVRDGLARTRV